MRLLLIRHAHAGNRRAWTGDDALRPLSERGHAEAAALVHMLRHEKLERVVSSPYQRCFETVQPLARAQHAETALLDVLREGTPVERVMGWIRSLGDATIAACSHGDVIGALISSLWEPGQDQSEPRWPKASTWVLEGAPEHPQLEFLAPPG